MNKTYLALRCQHNHKGRRDVSGAFRPELEAWADNRGHTFTHAIDNKKGMLNRYFQTMQILDDLIDAQEIIDEVAIFCHGWRTGIQIGFNNQNVNDLAERLGILAANEYLIVSLYCCSTGKGAIADGNGSFADLLRDRLCYEGITHCRVMGHTSKGHATVNPNVRFFDGLGSRLGGIGAPMLFKPGTRHWKAFKQALDDKTDFRLVFPLWSITKIVQYLEEKYID